MAYLSCLPDPQIMTGEDCRHINAVMERLSAAYHIKVEAEPAYFKIYKTPENCRKYIEFIEKEIETPITMISNGPGRDDIIYR